MIVPNAADRFREPMVPDVVSPPLRILVVEDEGLIALNLELILRRFGCDIIGPISKVDDVVDAAKMHRPDGAFLDVNLRGRKVFDVLPEMMELGVPCVLSSGYNDPMLFPAAFRNMPRIGKPFDEAALRRVCAAFGSLAEARQSGLSRQDLLSGQSHLTGHLGGESNAVAFPICRRFPLPELPVSAEAEEPSCAVAGLR